MTTEMGSAGAARPTDTAPAPWRGLLVLAGALVVADQAAKWAVRARLELGESVPVIAGVLDFTRVHNSGAAFGLLNGLDLPYKAAALAVVALVALAGVAVYAAALPATDWLARLGLTCIVGGAAGNLIDRVTLGYVVDYVDAYWRGWHFWAFNVADAAITVGAALMILDILGVGKRDASGTV
ncbi:MAG: signal peptidase II [Vicinamibacterales bacterium]